jgi:hypothetical protein
MAIKLTNSNFYDIYGNSSKEFKANAGDLILVDHEFEVEIGCVSSIENQLKIDKLENKLSRGQGSFLNDGFRIGQSCTLYIVNNTNGVTETFTSMLISNVTDLVLTITGLPNRNNWSTGTDYTAVLLSDSTYDSLNFAFNFADNDIPKENSPSLESLIDQETSKFVVEGLNFMSIGDTLPMTQIGKRSGQFSTSASITRISDISNPYTAFSSVRVRFNITVSLTFPAMFDPDSFIGDKCLKYYSKTSFKINSNDNLAPTVIEYKENATTGLWNEAYNTEVPICTQSDTINELFYNKGTYAEVTFVVPVSSGITQIQLGAMYLTVDDDYNKNKPLSQENYLPFVRTPLIGTGAGFAFPSSTDSKFLLYVNTLSYSDLGGLRTFTLRFTISDDGFSTVDFYTFMANRGDLDRQFYLWAKIGNTNRIIFEGQLTEYQRQGGLTERPDTFLINHDNNIDYKIKTNIINDVNEDFNLEDDIAYIAEFQLSDNDKYKTINAKVIVLNTANGYQFTLDKVSFDLTNVDLQYFPLQVTSVSNNLPDSSLKKEAFFMELEPYDSGIIITRLYYPFLIDWKYWEDVLSTHPYFVANNIDNKNWFNYQTGDWEIVVKLEFVTFDNIVDYNYTVLPFKTYDDWNGTSTIQLYDETETTEYTSLQENKKMLIKATHVFPTNYASYPWGMITIEPKENSPRFIMSTEIDKTQVDNPLTGIANPKRCDIQYLSANTIVLRSYVDTNLLNGDDFCITSKISDDGKLNNNPEEIKITEAGEDKLIETGTETKITD